MQTATLAVYPHEAAVLALADLNATLRLTLRSSRDTNHAEAADAFVLDAPAIARSDAPAPVAAPAAQAAPRKTRPGIQIIDGDRIQ